MKTVVQSSELQLTRDGHLLVAADRDAITLVELGGDGQQRIAVPGVQTITALGDQVWAATSAGTLVLFASDSRRLDEHAVPNDPDARLSPSTIGRTDMSSLRSTRPGGAAGNQADNSAIHAGAVYVFR